MATLVGHLADYDIRGGDIADAFAEEALAFARWHRDYDGAPGVLYVERLALTYEQALTHDLLDADEKKRAGRTAGPVLDGLVREFIESHLDPAIQRSVVEAEAEMRAEVVRLISGTQSPLGD